MGMHRIFEWISKSPQTRALVVSQHGETGVWTAAMVISLTPEAGTYKAASIALKATRETYTDALFALANHPKLLLASEGKITV